MSTYRRNGSPCDVPYLNRSTVALKGEHSRGKDKANRRKIFDEANFKSKEPGEVLCTITARDLDLDEVDTYQIVYGEYGDFDNKKIAHRSPLGSALWNSRRVGSIVKVVAPAFSYDILILDVK